MDLTMEMEVLKSGIVLLNRILLENRGAEDLIMHFKTY
jgi:hypothetical protein